MQSFLLMSGEIDPEPRAVIQQCTDTMGHGLAEYAYTPPGYSALETPLSPRFIFNKESQSFPFPNQYETKRFEYFVFDNVLRSNAPLKRSKLSPQSQGLEPSAEKH